MEQVKVVFIVLTCMHFLQNTQGAMPNSQTEEGGRMSRGFDPKSMLTNLATNIMSRGYVGGGGSQVVSLNLTNLLVLVLLKALIFAAGSLGAGTWKGGYARNLDGEESLISNEELLFYITYLTGEPGNNTCLQNLACQRPQEAQKYASAAEMLLKTSKVLNLDPDNTYEYSLRELEDATNFGKNQGNCDLRYTCGINNNINNNNNPYSV